MNPLLTGLCHSRRLTARGYQGWVLTPRITSRFSITAAGEAKKEEPDLEGVGDKPNSFLVSSVERSTFASFGFGISVLLLLPLLGPLGGFAGEGWPGF